MFGHGRHHGRHRGERGGGRRERVFDHGELRFVILHLIAEKPRHGYEMIKAIEEMAGGTYSPSPGVVYPTLTMLEDLGYAAAAPEEGGKKLYAITPEGQAFLAANRPAVDAILARLAEVSAGQGGRRVPQVLRAMANLNLAVGMRLTRGSLDEAQLKTVTAAIDAAATAVEQS